MASEVWRTWDTFAVILFTLCIGVSAHVHVVDTAVVEPDVLNNIGLTTLAEVAAAKKKLTK
jgi:hypothetical protein